MFTFTPKVQPECTVCDHLRQRIRPHCRKNVTFIDQNRAKISVSARILQEGSTSALPSSINFILRVGFA